MNVTIVLADDHPLLLSGNEQFLKNKGYTIVATVANGNDAYNAIVKNSPQIAILDFDMPIQNGLEVAKLCFQNQIATKIIILTLYKQEAISKQIGSTIHGYVLKDDDVSELDNAIKALLKDKVYVSKNIKENTQLKAANNLEQKLTATEIKILRYLSKDISSQEIADTLFISKRTVEKHRSNIIQKLGLKSSQNALLLWVQKNPELLNT